MPRVSQLSSTVTPSALTGTAMLSTIGRAVVVEHEHRREHVADGHLAGEHLAPGHAEAALDGRRHAAGPGEVGAAGGDEHDAFVGDAAQRRLGARQTAPVAPRREQRDVHGASTTPARSSRRPGRARAGPWRPGGSSPRGRRALPARRAPGSPTTCRRSKASVTKVPSRSCSAAYGAIWAPSSAAQATRDSSRVPLVMSGSITSVRMPTIVTPRLRR